MLITQLALLAVTGAYLVFFYRPTAVVTWNDLPSLVRFIHRWLSTLTIVTTVLLAVALIAGRSRDLGRWALGPTLVLANGVAVFTGFVLPWDLLALWAVTANTRLMGFVFGDEVRFVLVGGAEVAPETLQRVLLVHLALRAATFGAVIWLVRDLGTRTTSSGPAAAAPAGDPASR